jgi:hypothetical protein
MLAELQARNAVKQLQQLRGQVNGLTAHARTLTGKGSESFDARDLLDISTSLLKGLIKAHTDFEIVVGETKTLSRALSSKPPQGGGMSPAAKWVPEFRAGAKQLMDAIGEAEKAIKKLAEMSKTRLNAPTRTATGAPDGVLDAVFNLIELLNKLIEFLRHRKT